MPYLKEGEEGEKEGRRDRALPSSQRQLPQRYHLQILKWSYERLIYTICWFGFIGQELLILGFWRTTIVDSTQIENQHSGRRMTFWKYTFPLCWSETTKWVTESTKWEYISTKWVTETAKGVTETTRWESKKQQSGQRVLYRRKWPLVFGCLYWPLCLDKDTDLFPVWNPQYSSDSIFWSNFPIWSWTSTKSNYSF